MYAGIIFYNDGVDFLSRAVESAKAAGLQVITVDGAYRDYPRNTPGYESTPDMVEYAKENSFFIPCPETGWQDQCVKRTAYLMNVIGYVLQLDADEVIESGPIPEPKGDAYMVNVMEQRGGSLLTWAAPRCFKAFPDLIYANSHNYLYDASKMTDDPKDGLMYRGEVLPFLKDINGNDVTIYNQTHLRPKERKIVDGVYREWRKEVKVEGYNWKVNVSKASPVLVQYLGKEIYNGPFVGDVKTNQIFTVPEWEYDRLTMDYGTVMFKKL